MFFMDKSDYLWKTGDVLLEEFFLTRFNNQKGNVKSKILTNISTWVVTHIYNTRIASLHNDMMIHWLIKYHDFDIVR